MGLDKGLVVITGATGFIGSHLTEHLISEGYRVRALVRKTSNLRYIENTGAEIVVCPLTDSEGLEKNFADADYIFHLAGTVKARNYEGYLEGNVGTTQTVLEAALPHADKIKNILVSSSLAVVGPNKVGHPSNEMWEYNPISQYGKSKVEQEKLCHSYMNRLPIVILRPPSVYGPRDTEIFTVFKAMSQGAFSNVGFKRKTLSMIYVSDLVRGMRQAMESDRSSGETYFISSEEEYDYSQIIKYSKMALGKGFLVITVPNFVVFIVAFFSQLFASIQGKAATLNLEKAKEVVQDSWACSPEKAKKELGYEQRVSLEEGIAISIKWYKEKGWIK